MSILGPGLMLLLPSGFWLLSGQDEAAAGAAGWLGREEEPGQVASIPVPPAEIAAR